MYDVILAVKSPLILRELKRLRIWGEVTGFQISQITEDFEQLMMKLQQKKYDLLLIENLPDNHMISYLRKIKNEGLCRSAAVVCSYVDFNIVRKSFLLGADDFFVTPFEVSHFISLFSKIENADHGKIAAEICQKEELLTLFENVDFSIRERLDQLIYQTMAGAHNSSETYDGVKRILESVITEIFEKYEWLKLYFNESECISVNHEAKDLEEELTDSVEDFYTFFTEFAQLYPKHGEGLEEIIKYILNNPEGDLKQKSISEELYINRSYLSTVFTAQTEINFVDYVTTVKLKRAAWLLKHTKMKIIDIAGVLDYKDMGYFLKRFKAKYGVTPSQYRIPENYEFHI